MSRKTLSPASVFEMVLRAHETGGVTFVDVRLQLKQLLASGASPADLLETLRRQQQWEPLSERAHSEVLGLIDEAMRAAPKNDDVEVTAASPTPVVEDVPAAAAADSNDREDADPSPRQPSRPGSQARGSQTERPVRAENLRSLEARIAGQQADYTALTRAYERAREAESTATARAAALADDLSIAQAERASERLKAQQLGETLAETVAAGETLRSRAKAAAQEAQETKAEITHLRESQQAHDAEFEEIRRRLVERDAQLESLEQERQSMLPQWAAHAAQLAEARGALTAERARIEALDGALRVRDNALVEVQRSLTARDAELSALQQERARMAPQLDARATAATQMEAELHTTQASLAAEKAKSLRVEQSVAQAQAELARFAAQQAQNASAQDSALMGLRESLSARDAAIAGLKTEQQGAQEIARQLTEQAASSASALMRSEAELRAAVARIDALSRELANREVPVARPPLLVSVPKPVAPNPAPALVIAAQPTAAPPLLPAPSTAPAKRALGLRWVAATAALLICVLAAYFLSHRPLPTQPPVAITEPVVIVPKAGTVIRDCLTCPEFTVLPTGKFAQGSSGIGSGVTAFEKPMHEVAIRSVIGMATNLVTVDEFQQFITASGYESQGCTTYDGEWKQRPKNSWSNPGFVQSGKHPVTCASWNDAKAYAKWLSAKSGHSYRLPSASEWEYAARAGGQAVTPWSAESAACENANVADKSAVHRYPGWAAFNCDDGYVYTSPVGSFKRNAFGLNDMLGNVFQWTEDCWRPDYVGAPIDGSARTGGQCVEHELRGGSWFTTPAYVRANYRNHFTADYRSSTVGIRLVRDFGS